jgi:hypothetical protein
MGEHIATTNRTLLWLPVEWGQGVQVEAVGQRRQPGKDIAQVGLAILCVALAGDDDRVNDGGALTGVRVADKQPVLQIMCSYA